MFSFHLHCTVWSQKDIHWYGRKLSPSSVVHFAAIPEQAASPTPTAPGFLPLLCPLLGFLCEPAKSSSTLLQELEVTGTAFFMPFFPFPEKLVSRSVLPLLCWAWLLLAEEVGMCFWNATDGVGRSKAMAGPNWAEFVLLNINFAHLCNSPSVSWIPAMTLLQSRWLVTTLPSIPRVLIPTPVFTHFPQPPAPPGPPAAAKASGQTGINKSPSAEHVTQSKRTPSSSPEGFCYYIERNRDVPNTNTLKKNKTPNLYHTFSQVINSLYNQSKGSSWEARGSLSLANFKKDEF